MSMPFLKHLQDLGESLLEVEGCQESVLRGFVKLIDYFGYHTLVQEIRMNITQGKDRKYKCERGVIRQLFGRHT
jgi:hypothetical protein